jgi:hypothetical protein
MEIFKEGSVSHESIIALYVAIKLAAVSLRPVEANFPNSYMLLAKNCSMPKMSIRFSILRLSANPSATGIF